MGRREARYAAALLNTAGGPEAAEACEAALQFYAAALEQHGELRQFLLHPALPGDAKKRVLAKLAPPDTPQNVHNLLCLLVDRGCVGSLPGIFLACRELRAERCGVLSIRVSTPRPLDEETLRRIRAHFVRRCKKKDARLEVVVDPALIGGIRVQAGNTRYDRSIAGQLSDLRRQIQSPAKK